MRKQDKNVLFLHFHRFNIIFQSQPSCTVKTISQESCIKSIIRLMVQNELKNSRERSRIHGIPRSIRIYFTVDTALFKIIESNNTWQHEKATFPTKRQPVLDSLFSLNSNLPYAFLTSLLCQRFTGKGMTPLSLTKNVCGLQLRAGRLGLKTRLHGSCCHSLRDISESACRTDSERPSETVYLCTYVPMHMYNSERTCVKKPAVTPSFRVSMF